jgi:hypothetical protein
MRAIVRSYVKKTLSRPVEVRVRGLITSIHTLDPHTYGSFSTLRNTLPGVF